MTANNPTRSSGKESTDPSSVDLRRRRVISVVGIGSVLALAGCVGDTDDDTDPGDDTDDEPEPADDTDDTDDDDAPEPDDDTDDTDDEPEPDPEAVLEVVEYDFPEEVEAGEEWSWSVTVENTGGADGTFESGVFFSEPDGQREHLGDISLDVPAGESAIYESDTAAFPYVTRIEFYFDEPDESVVVSILTATLNFGEYFRNPDGIEMTVNEVDLRSSYTYEDWDGSDATEEASSGYQWAFVYFEATNDSGSSEWLPWEGDVNILVNGSQYDNEYIHKEEGRYEGGSEVADGVTREGWLAYEVPDDLSVSDLDIHHSDRDFFGDWEVIWRE